jgi:hypothetical protein
MRLPSFPEYEVRVRCKFFLNAVTYWLIKTTRMCSNWIVWKFKLVTLPFFLGRHSHPSLSEKLWTSKQVDWTNLLRMDHSQLCCKLLHVTENLS